MLVITRKPGQKIMLGDDVSVEVLAVGGSKVRLGVTAPRALPVHREEIWIAIQAERIAAADGAAAGDPGPPGA